MKSDDKRFISTAFLIYFFANALIAAVCLIVLLLLPTDPKNAWIIGLSRNRLALIVVFIFIVLLFLYLGVKSFRNPRFNQVINEKVINFVSEYRLILLVMLPVYGFTFIVLFGYFYLQIRYQAITSLQVFLDRLLPLILFGFSFIILTSLLIFLVNSKIPITQPESKILYINPKKVFIVLILVMVLLILVSIFINLFILLDIQVFRVARRIFDLNTERNIPTLFSSVTLLGASMLLGYIAYLTRLTGGRYSLLWAILAFGFLFLSIDETAYIHENLSEDVAGWIFVVAPFVILFLLGYIRFFLHLPRKTKLLFLLAGILYIGGAFFLEFIGSWRISIAGEDRIATTLLFTSIEESFEMFGINLLIYALLLYLQDIFPNYYLGFQKPFE